MSSDAASPWPESWRSDSCTYTYDSESRLFEVPRNCPGPGLDRQRVRLRPRASEPAISVSRTTRTRGDPFSHGPTAVSNAFAIGRGGNSWSSPIARPARCGP